VKKCEHVRMDVITAVANLVRSYGVVVYEPVSLRSTNNVVVWLSPSSVVAKISSEHDRAVAELEIARALVELDAPVVPPADFGAEQPTRVGEMTVTFWRYQPQDDAHGPSSELIASSLFTLHSKLALMPDRAALPSHKARLTSAVSALERPKFAAELVEEDRALLRRVLVDGMARLSGLDPTDHVIHGSPHRLNILVVHDAPRFIDFETVERGPREWDLAHLEQRVADTYHGDLDEEVLALCRVMISAATSIWCWEGVHRGPDMRSHAQHHLERVRLLHH
jgi:hypothetical protein